MPNLPPKSPPAPAPHSSTNHSSTNQSPANQPPAKASRQQAVKTIEFDRFVDKRIEQTRRMVKATDLLASFTTLASILLGILLVATVTEHWLIPGGFRPGTRTAIWGVMLIGSGVYFARYIAPLLMQRVNSLYAADELERDTPELKNSLVNLLQLRQQGTTSKAIQRTLEQQAAERLANTGDHSIDMAPLLRVAYVLVGVVVLTGLYMVLSPKDYITSAGRIIVPWSEVAAPSRVQIEDLTPGNATVSQGDRLPVSLRIIGLEPNESAELVYSTEDGRVIERRILLTVGDTSVRYSTELPPPGEALGLQSSFHYRIEAGDARTRDYSVEVHTAPTIAPLSIQYEYPEYTGFVNRTVDAIGDLQAIEGTRVTITAEANLPIASASLDFDADGRPDVRMQIKEQQATATFVMRRRNTNNQLASEKSQYVIRFKATNDQTNDSPALYDREIIADLPPEAQLLLPEEEILPVRLDDEVEISIEARDPDFALGSVKLIGQIDGKQILKQELLRSGKNDKGHQGRFVTSHYLTPRKLGLKGGETLTYWVQVTDNRTPSPNQARSKEQRLQILADSRSKNPNQEGEADPSEQEDSEQDPSQQEEGQGQSSDEGDSNQGDSGDDNSNEGESNEEGASESQSEEGQTGESSDSSEGENQSKEGTGRENDNGSGEDGSEEANSEENSSEQDGQQNRGSQQQGDQQEDGQQEDGQQSDSGQSSGQQESDSSDKSSNTAGEETEGEKEGGIQGKSQDESDEAERDNSGAGGGTERDSSDPNHTPDPKQQGGGNGSKSNRQEGGKESSAPPESGMGDKQVETKDDSPVADDGSDDGAAFDRIQEHLAKKQDRKPKESNPDRQTVDRKPGDERKPGEPDEKHLSDSPNDDEGQNAQRPEVEGKPQGEPKDPTGKDPEREPKESDNQEGEQGEGKSSDSQTSESTDSAKPGQDSQPNESPREGTGSTGQNQAADDGSGQSGDRGEGKTSGRSGNQQEADDQADRNGDGQSDQQRDGGRPGSPSDADPSSPGGEQSSDTDGNGSSKNDNSSRDSNSNGRDGEEQESREGNPSGPSGGGNQEAFDRPEGNFESTDLGEDEANLDYARKQTELVLEKLSDQLADDQVDQDLLDKLGWSEDDLRRFVNRWQERKRRSNQSTSKGESEFDAALRSLGIGEQPRQIGGGHSPTKDSVRDLQQGHRTTIPPALRERLRRYNQGVSDDK